MKCKLFAGIGAVLAVALLFASCTPGKEAASSGLPGTDTSQSEESSTGTVSDRTSSGTENEGTSAGLQAPSAGTVAARPVYDSADETVGASQSGVAIRLNGTTVSASGTGVTARGGIATITQAGTYTVSGTLSNGQIIVDASDDATVYLVLAGADITSQASAPIYIKKADKTVITLAAGTSNTVTDAQLYTYDDAEKEEPNAAIFSKDDLTINGTGSLTVNARFNNGIASKDDLKILGGTIAVNAADDGVMGRDSVAVRGGSLQITAADDGIKSTNDEDAQKGYIAVEGGTIRITAGGDGIQALTTLRVSGGDIRITSGGGSTVGSTQSGWGSWNTGSANDDTDKSAKGLKADNGIEISGGSIEIDSSDDSIHSNNTIVISGGVMKLSSGDDGIHSDAALTISAGTIDIAKSYEGLESLSITISGGDIRLVASDDGINAAGGNDGSSMNGRPGQNGFRSGGSGLIDIRGGNIVVNASGDGVDANGSIKMSAGTLIINGPTDNGNGALDYDGGFAMSGGVLVAAGSAGMTQAPDSSSAQCSVSITYASSQAAGTLARITDSSGNTLLAFAPAKSYRSLIICSPDLRQGQICTVYAGGSCTGKSADGLYTGGSCSGGSEVMSFTISGTVTNATQAGASGGMNGNGGMNGGRPGRW